MRKLILAMSITTVVVLWATSPSLADDIVCDTLLCNDPNCEPIEVKLDNVIVPSGQLCTLQVPRVLGNVIVEPGGALVILGTKVIGNVQAVEAAFIDIGGGARIIGDVQIEKTAGVPAPGTPNRICDTMIRGNIQIEDTDIVDDFGVAAAMDIANNNIKGNLQFKANKTSVGTFEISLNRAKNNIQCFDNDPAPAIAEASGNTARGDIQGQCAFGDVEGEGEYVCDRLFNDWRFDNLLVPAGAACTVEASKVKGNVKVEVGGSLVLRDTRVRGNIQSVEAAFIDIGGGSKVIGDVQIDKTAGVPALGTPNRICDSTIKGDIQLKGNKAPFAVGCELGNLIRGDIQIGDTDIVDDFGVAAAMDIANNNVKGDLQFKANNTSFGSFDLTGNFIRKNVQCFDNDPAPTGGENDVRGDVQGQCVGLTVVAP